MATDELIIYHNPRCSKSRASLQILEQNNCSPKVIEYLQHPPGRQELSQIVANLGVRASALVRVSEAEFNADELDLKSATDAEVIDYLMLHPGLLQRPIIVLGNKAVIGRPPERVLQLIPNNCANN